MRKWPRTSLGEAQRSFTKSLPSLDGGCDMMINAPNGGQGHGESKRQERKAHGKHAAMDVCGTFSSPIV